MTITDYQALKRWFFNNSRGEKPAPYWTLYSLNIGDKKTMLTRNDRLSSMNEAWTFLEESLQAMSAKGGQFEVMQTDVPRGNNPVGTIWFEPARSNGALPAIAGMPGNGSGAPTGYFTKEDVEQMLEDAHEKWELQARIGALEEQLRTPAQAPTLFDQVKEFAATPVGTALLAKLAGVDLGALGALVNGTPNPGEPATDDDEELEQMDAKIQHMAQTVGVSEPELVAKLYKFTQTQPEVARNLIAQL